MQRNRQDIRSYKTKAVTSSRPLHKTTRGTSPQHSLMDTHIRNKINEADDRERTFTI